MIQITRTEQQWRAIADALPKTYEQEAFKHEIVRALNVGSTILLIEPRHALFIQEIEHADPEPEHADPEPEPAETAQRPVGGKTIILRLPASDMQFVANAVRDARGMYDGVRARENCRVLSQQIEQAIKDQKK